MLVIRMNVPTRMFLKIFTGILPILESEKSLFQTELLQISGTKECTRIEIGQRKCCVITTSLHHNNQY